MPANDICVCSLGISDLCIFRGANELYFSFVACLLHWHLHWHSMKISLKATAYSSIKQRETPIPQLTKEWWRSGIGKNANAEPLSSKWCVSKYIEHFIVKEWLISNAPKCSRNNTKAHQTQSHMQVPVERRMMNVLQIPIPLTITRDKSRLVRPISQASSTVSQHWQ